MSQERKLVKQFDTDGDGRLDATERAAARAFLKADAGGGQNRRPGRGGGPPFGPGGGPPGGRTQEPASPGPRVDVAQVRNHPDADLYDPTVFRTFFLDFEDEDWQAELIDFYNTDVEVPATLTADGVRYPNVGVHFRGASSFFMVAPEHKRSFNVSLDFVDPKQRLHGHKTLNLLNSNGDPSFMSSVLYSQLARAHIPAPRANFSKVVVNGESWGVFVNIEQFDKGFVDENYPGGGPAGSKSSKAADGHQGARWKVKGSPNGASGLDYIGDDLDAYRKRYQIKTKDDDRDWEALRELCRTLSQTPIEELEAAVRPILDVDGVLWFLALDVALVNSDGYWVRASDFSIYRDPKGVFHIIPHDMNEAFALEDGPPPGGRFPGGPRPGLGPDGAGPERPAFDRPGPDQARPDQLRPDQLRPDGAPPDRPQRGPGRGPRMRPPGVELDPLVGMDDARKPLRSRLLAVPRLRAAYLDHIRAIAHDLDWTTLGPIVAEYRSLIADEVKADTRKSSSFVEFEEATADDLPPAPAEGGPAPKSLRGFAEKRRAYLLARLAALEAESAPAATAPSTPAAGATAAPGRP